MSLRSVKNSIRVLVDYDIPTKYRLYRLLQSDNQFFVKSKGRKISRSEYHRRLTDTIDKYIHSTDASIFDERGNEFYRTEKDSVEPETIRSFLAIKLQTPLPASKASGSIKHSQSDRTLAGVALKTMQFVDLYCQAAYPNEVIHPRTGDFLNSLGRLTATQYRGEPSSVDPARIALMSSKKIFFAAVDDINIISPLKINALLVSLYPVPDRAFAVVQVFAISRWKGDMADIFRDSKREWFQEHYGGIGVITRDGLSCHLNSKSLHIPLYGLFRLSSDLDGINLSEVAIRFFDYSVEIQDFGDTIATYLRDERIESIIDNIGWYM
jgi:hypothetical protein